MWTQQIMSVLIGLRGLEGSSDEVGSHRSVQSRGYSSNLPSFQQHFPGCCVETRSSQGQLRSGETSRKAPAIIQVGDDGGLD